MGCECPLNVLQKISQTSLMFDLLKRSSSNLDWKRDLSRDAETFKREKIITRSV